MERNFQPVIIFSFSKKECEAYALQMSKLDFNSGEMRSTGRVTMLLLSRSTITIIVDDISRDVRESIINDRSTWGSLVKMQQHQYSTTVSFETNPTFS